MGRKLDEMDLDDPFDRLITLPSCRHVFTVETLDGVCGLKDWYTYDEVGQRWTGLRVPETALQVPVCPTCRAPVTSPRYGRMFKAADLDILEKNVVTKMTQGLRGVQTDLEILDFGAIGNAIAEALKQVTSITSTPITQQAMRAITKQRNSVFAQAPRLQPIHVDHLKDDKLFTFAAETSRVWKAHIRPILKLLGDISKVTSVRPAHIHAWESAFTYLYNQEIESAASSPETAPRNPQEHAMRMAKLKLGQAHPRADKRFLVEAIWTGVSLRFALLHLVCKVVETISTKTSVFSQDERAAWAQYGSFILRSCKRDSLLTFDIAEGSQAHRQMTKARIYILHSGLEEFRFRRAMVEFSGRLKEQREHLLLDAEQQSTSAKQLITQTIREYRIAFPKEAPSWTWLDKNFVEATDSILEEWANVERSLRQHTFYEPLTQDEKFALVKAMNFSECCCPYIPS